MSNKKQKATDPARFEGNGISYRAKLMGSEVVAEARGDKMCQEAIQKLKGAVKASGQHKQRIFINITLEGLKIIDGASMNVLHTHPVHQISFISRDVTDSRAFGYVFGAGDGSHKFYGIKTASSAENVVLALRDLFQTVYEMKKQEMEESKAKATLVTQAPSEDKDTTKSEATTEVKPVENADNIEQGIEQIRNMDFDDMTSEDSVGQNTTTTSVTTVTIDAPVTASLTDPWGLTTPVEASAVLAKTTSSSALSDLEGLSSGLPPSNNPFSGMQAFTVAPASTSAAFFGLGQPTMPFGQQCMIGPSMGVPVTSDPFGDPFNTSQAQQQMAAAQMLGSTPMSFGNTVGGFGNTSAGFGNTTGGLSTSGGFGMQPAFSSPFTATVGSSPFLASVGAPTPAQPLPGAMAASGAPGMQTAFGRASPSFSPFGAPAPVTSISMAVPQGGAVADPFLPSSDSLLQPARSGGQEEKGLVSPVPSSLFDDLLSIKMSGGAESATKSPKEMFQPPPKKSMNEMKGGGAPQASVFVQDPFIEDPFGSIDTMLNTVATSDTDPFGIPHLSATSSSSPLPPPSLPHPPPAPPDPQPDLTLSSASSKESSPETSFDVPSEPPPPLPAHLMLGTAVPSPPLRPPPIPNRPMPKMQKNSPAKSVSCSFSTPPPLPTTPRPSSSIASSSPASELSSSDTVPSGAEGFKEMQSSRDPSAQNSPRVTYPGPPLSPSHSWGSSSSLSHSSSQKSLEKSTIVADNDDPFGVPLRSKRSFSATDGASKRSSRSSGKLSVKSDSKVSVSMDPFSVALKDRTNSSEGSGGSKADMDNPFCTPAFSDSVASSSSPWEAFGALPVNVVADTKKPAVSVTTNGQRIDSSPFTDPFFSTPMNGKPTGTQS